MNDGENPPKMTIEFFEDQKNLENINCFSNEGSKWRKTKIVLIDNILNINFAEKFIELPEIPELIAPLIYTIPLFRCFPTMWQSLRAQISTSLET